VPSAQVNLDSISTSEIVQDTNLSHQMNLIELEKSAKSDDKLKSQPNESLVNCEVQCEMNLTVHNQQQNELTLSQSVQDQSKGTSFEDKLDDKSSNANKGANGKQAVTMLG
jgi:hypothetical protein